MVLRHREAEWFVRFGSHSSEAHRLDSQPTVAALSIACDVDMFQKNRQKALSSSSSQKLTVWHGLWGLPMQHCGACVPYIYIKLCA